MVTITIKDPRAFVGFDNFRRTYMGFTNREVMQPVAKEAEKRLKKYAQPPLRYMRTYTYQRSWHTWNSSGNTWRIQGYASYQGNPDYTSFVIGDEQGQGQVQIHSGRWPVGFKSGKDLVEKTAMEFASRADAKYVSFMRSYGL